MGEAYIIFQACLKCYMESTILFLKHQTKQN